MKLSNFSEIASLNNFGVSALAKGNDGLAIKSFKAAMLPMRDAIVDSEYMDITFESKDHQVSGFLPIDSFGCSSFYIYRNGLLLNATEDTDLIFCNSLILFNLALAFHQRGARCGHEAHLRKAQNVYSLCLELANGGIPCLSALRIAILNNSAHIQFELADYESASETLNSLHQEVSRVFSSDQTIFEQMHMDEIYLNVLLSTPPITAACA